MNTSTHTGARNGSSLFFDKNLAVILMYSISSVIAFILNGAVMLSAYLIRDRSCGTKISANISFNNILGSAIIVPLNGQGDSWLLQEHMCLFMIVLTTMWRLTALFLTLLALLEAYRRMYRHYRKRGPTNPNKNWTETKIIVAWMCACAMSLFSFLFSSIQRRPLCLPFQHSYVGLIQAYYGFILVCLLGMLALNLSYIYVVRKQTLLEETYRTGPAESPQHGVADLSFCTCGLYVFHAIFLLWLPYIGYMLYLTPRQHKYQRKEYQDNIGSYTGIKVLQSLSYATCLVQPAIVLKHNHQVTDYLKGRTRVKKILNANSRIGPAPHDLREITEPESPESTSGTSDSSDNHEAGETKLNRLSVLTVPTNSSML